MAKANILSLGSKKSFERKRSSNQENVSEPSQEHQQKQERRPQSQSPRMMTMRLSHGRWSPAESLEPFVPGTQKIQLELKLMNWRRRLRFHRQQLSLETLLVHLSNSPRLSAIPS